MSKLLKFNKISKRIAGKKILDSITFFINSGEISGYVGPNGAGKTTTIKLMLGILKSDEGNIKIFGKSISILPLAYRKKISCVFDYDGLNSFLTGYENLQYYCNIYEIPDAEKTIKYWVKRLNIDNDSQKRVKILSKGQRQIIALARALIVDAELIIMDEPFNSLDPSARKNLARIIKEISIEKKRSFFISSHDLTYLENICDTVGFLKSGKLKLWERLDTLQNEALKDGIVIKGKSDEILKLKDILVGDKILSNDCLLIRDQLHISGDNKRLFKEISNIIYANNINIDSVSKQQKKSLQEIYSQVMNG